MMKKQEMVDAEKRVMPVVSGGRGIGQDTGERVIVREDAI